jgi:hypothetical protein
VKTICVLGMGGELWALARGVKPNFLRSRLNLLWKSKATVL